MMNSILILMFSTLTLAQANDATKLNKIFDGIVGKFTAPPFPTNYGGDYKPSMEINKSKDNSISFKIKIASQDDGSFGPATDSGEAVYDGNEGFVFRDPAHDPNCKIVIKKVGNEVIVEDPLEKCNRNGSAMQIRHKLVFTLENKPDRK